MRTRAIDLDAYFERIGYDGGHEPTLDTLGALHLRHVQTIPFENLNPLLRWPVELDARSLEQKLVHGGRGGYCFEQNLLFGHALAALGFETTGLAARVMWNRPEGAAMPRSHMLLLVSLEEGPHLADVGFGGMTLTGPLRLQPDVEQPTPHETFRLVRVDQEFVMQAETAGTWRPLYRFSLEPQLLPDYEVTNWYLSNHPDSQFVTTLIAARPDADRRYGLRDTELTTHHREGRTERRVLGGVADLRAALQNVFRVRLPDSPALDAALTRVVARAAVA